MSDQDALDLALGRRVRALLASQRIENYPHADRRCWWADVHLRRYDVDVNGQPWTPRFYVNYAQSCATPVESLDAAVEAAAREAGIE